MLTLQEQIQNLETIIQQNISPENKQKIYLTRNGKRKL